MINIIENIWRMCRTRIGSAMMKFEDVEILSFCSNYQSDSCILNNTDVSTFCSFIITIL